MDLLWPDENVDAQAAFDVALSRLRKLLGHDGLIQLSDGMLRLDRERVWCDAWTFLRLIESPDPRSPDAVARVLALYRGPLLGELGEATIPPWAAAVRERLRGNFLRATAQFAARAEAAGDWSGAIALYERGVDQDTLAEDFYRGLMRCHLAQGAPANALRAYRRCRELLSIVLGAQPTAETEALHRAIHL